MSAETYTGKPCPRGHTLRYRSNRKCVACYTLEVRYIVEWPNGALHPREQVEPRANDTLWRAVRVK